MKNILFIILIGVVFLGCTKRLETNLDPYVTMNQNKKQNMSVNFFGVKDKRDTTVVSTVLDDGLVQEQYGVSNNIKIWYREAFIRELKNVDMYENDLSAVTVLVNIKKIEVTYNNDKLDKKNMQARITLELVIKKGKKTITSNISIQQTAYKLTVSDASDFEDILNEIMKDSVSKTVSILIKKLHDK